MVRCHVSWKLFLSNKCSEAVNTINVVPCDLLLKGTKRRFRSTIRCYPFLFLIISIYFFDVVLSASYNRWALEVGVL